MSSKRRKIAISFHKQSSFVAVRVAVRVVVDVVYCCCWCSVITYLSASVLQVSFGAFGVARKRGPTKEVRRLAMLGRDIQV